MDKVQDVIDQLKTRDPQAIFLFGSYAWGTPNKDSDVDVLVIEKHKQDFHERLKEIYMMLDGKTPVDVIAMDHDQLLSSMVNNSFYRQIVSKGKLMYGSL